MEKLQNFNLCPPEARVLDLGAGIGKLSDYLTAWGCEVVAIEARDDSIAVARQRYPELDIRKGDVCSLPDGLGEFDTVMAFGLMYHLPDPMPMLREAHKHAPVLAMETIVTDAQGADMHPTPEPPAADQSLTGLGCRPTPAFVQAALREVGYTHIYEPTEPPDYPDYKWTPKNDKKFKRGGRNLRVMYVASKKALYKSRHPGLKKIS